MHKTMFLADGRQIYPSYMTNEDKEQLKTLIGNRKDFMWCGCKATAPDDEKLYYRISADNRFIPCYQGYQHELDCSRYATKRNSAYIANDNADIVAYLKFNPLTFSIPSTKKEKAEEETNTEEKATEEEIAESLGYTESEENTDNNKSKEKVEREPYFSLEELIRSINIDAYMERLIGSGKILSRDYFLTVINSRTKKVRIAGMEKPLRALTLNEDRCSFFYCPLADINQNEKGFWNVALDFNGKQYTYIINQKIIERALSDYAKKYNGEGIKPDEKIMVSGFIYKKLSRHMKEYLTIGRIVLFKTTTYEGIYCRSNLEKQVFELILKFIHYNKNHNIQLHIPVEEEQYDCQIFCGNKFGNIFYDKIPRGYEGPPAIELCGEEVPPEKIADFINRIVQH